MKDRLLSAFVTLLFLPAISGAALLENPSDGSTQSGVNVVFGWKCQASGDITIRFDKNQEFKAAYGTVREDTEGECGDSNNGYSFLWNWGRLNDGEHLVEVLDNGQVFDSATVTVVTFGPEFLRNASSSCSARDFPGIGDSSTLEWNEPSQSFVVVEVNEAQAGTCGAATGTTERRDQRATFSAALPCTNDTLVLSVTAPGSNSDGFFLCDSRLDFVQNGKQFNDDAFEWATEGGGFVCEDVLPGATLTTFVDVLPEFSLDFSKPFDLFYDSDKVFSFE